MNLTSIISTIRAFVRGEPLISFLGAAIISDFAFQLAGDGLDRDEALRIVLLAVAGYLARGRATSAANPELPSRSTEVVTLSGWRR